jgi:hypothetical protein
MHERSKMLSSVLPESIEWDYFQSEIFAHMKDLVQADDTLIASKS